MTPTRGMNETCGGLKGIQCPRLRLAGRGSSDVDFCKRTNERDRVEGVTDPHHRETVGDPRNQMRSVGTLEFNALVEIINGFPEPHPDD